MRRPLRLVIAGLVGVGVFAAGATTLLAQSSSPTTITAAPAFTAAQLNAYASDNWTANGGDLRNDRFSTLTTITKTNVSTLTQAWATNLGVCPSGTAACGSEEATPVEYDGTLYLQTPESGVFALSATTGQILWHFTPPYATWDPGYNPGSGGRQPGVAVANGTVFVGLADGSLVALNQLDGAVAWRTILMPWQQGGRLSAAPQYYDGMVIEPTSGGDGGGLSNTVEAVNATTGELLWSWGIVPQAGQPGANSWSTANGGAYTAYNYGGGATWQTPAIDVKDGLVIFGTGNPVPWNTRGPGNNLYTDSIVALNVFSGQLKWAYQTVHHDLWDSDLPNNAVLYTAKTKGGKKVTAVAMIAKYGWTWLLNAKTGKLLEKVNQVKVPQDSAPGVNTAKTQPIPVGPNTLFMPKMPHGQGRVCASQTYWNGPMTGPNGTPIKFGCDFDPYDTTAFVVTPFENMDWPSASYSPVTNGFITCGDNGREFGHEQVPAASEVVRPAGGIGAGVLSVGNTDVVHTGNFSSLNVTTNKFEFHQKWATVCYSGEANTASGLTFVGQAGAATLSSTGIGTGNNGLGDLEAVSTATGATLWTSPAMVAPASAPPITYSVNGTQYVAIIDGGESHDDPSLGKRGSMVYAFALPG